MEWSDRKFQLAVILLLLVILTSIFLLDFLKQDESVDSVAYVNLKRVFAEHPAKTAAEKKLNQKAAEYQQQLEQKGEELTGAEQKELLQSYQKELENLEAELLASVLNEVETIIIETAAAKRVKFVLEEEDVLYGGYNLTDDVLAELKANW
ncbi:MAG: outer membrane protein [Halanaerobium sp. 4-GBenrich]|jgi:outer membrane protein|uniref:Periplasmic chaperone for outer membrane proteins Skp n=1 Tax=Halanaerobium congolense TaxID=54121 RepID=A0A1G6J3S4_9FIRM|nr:OmpH family outer membrane protein [Halanaerobium congolense]ODS50594.1 MAG: outer membrane protein [Halanaerobium sp. 4-GBenrich]PTX15801.1 periplasmic chaperone for outer membrane proteins Skp [Halanaerobium congolense]TDS33984.1 periplasmic chaperone for outer membrane proteins Skp [Halanaerobium congolense]TDX45236.1 periplasmic chaperone for outer membrane proteins Skp [Halanaerobium congolense]SDC13472.1 periplasmic chaperone for outer membrane proteins Skp [Halanaerobium congolense]